MIYFPPGRGSPVQALPQPVQLPTVKGSIRRRQNGPPWISSPGKTAEPPPELSDAIQPARNQAMKIRRPVFHRQRRRRLAQGRQCLGTTGGHRRTARRLPARLRRLRQRDLPNLPWRVGPATKRPPHELPNPVRVPMTRAGIFYWRQRRVGAGGNRGFRDGGRNFPPEFSPLDSSL